MIRIYAAAVSVGQILPEGLFKQASSPRHERIFPLQDVQGKRIQVRLCGTTERGDDFIRPAVDLVFEDILLYEILVIIDGKQMVRHGLRNYASRAATT